MGRRRKRRTPGGGVGERSASAGWWRRATRRGSASPAACHAVRRRCSSPRRPTRNYPGTTLAAPVQCTGPHRHRRQAAWALPLAMGRLVSTWGSACRASTMGLTPHVRQGCAPRLPQLRLAASLRIENGRRHHPRLPVLRAPGVAHPAGCSALRMAATRVSRSALSSFACFSRNWPLVWMVLALTSPPNVSGVTTSLDVQWSRLHGQFQWRSIP